MMKYLFLLLLSISAAAVSCSQKPFQKEIEAYQREDERSAPPKNAIVFVGSSSFRLWKNVQSDFPGHTIINRGFGGSGLDHATTWADDIIIKYQPRQVVIYSGENDIAGGKVKPADMIYRFKNLFKKIRTALPNTHIVYVSMKPSPSREQFRSVIVESNKLIREFLATQKNTDYVDVYSLMLDASGKPRQELFTSDDLHMNRKGYEIWKKAIEPALVK
jgi:lysophospholipase L1-like esterase